MFCTGILAITVAEAFFWACGYPAALVYYKLTTNEWIDVFSKDGAFKAGTMLLHLPHLPRHFCYVTNIIFTAGFSVGYGGFATGTTISYKFPWNDTYILLTELTHIWCTKFLAILQYRVTIAAIPLIPVMDKYVVPVISKFVGDKFNKQEETVEVQKGSSAKKAPPSTPAITKATSTRIPSAKIRPEELQPPVKKNKW